MSARIEVGRGSDSFAVKVDNPMIERGSERGYLVVARFDSDQSEWVSRRLGGDGLATPGFIQGNREGFLRYGIEPYLETISEYSNLITTAAWARILTLAIPGCGQAWDPRHPRLP